MKTDDITETSTVAGLADAARERAKCCMDAGVDALHAVSGKAREIGRNTDQYVHEKPWLAIGAAAGAGLLIGFLLRGRRD